MTTTTWAEVLQEIRVKEEHITDELVKTLTTSYGFDLSGINEESFNGYYNAASKEEAGRAVAKEFSSMHGLQDFLESAIDWDKAWENLIKEGYILIPANEAGAWMLFSKIPG